MTNLKRTFDALVDYFEGTACPYLIIGILFAIVTTVAAPLSHAQPLPAPPTNAEELNPEVIANISIVRRTVTTRCLGVEQCRRFLQHLTNDREITKRLRILLDKQVPIILTDSKKDENSGIHIGRYGSVVVPSGTDLRKVGKFLGVIYFKLSTQK